MPDSNPNAAIRGTVRGADGQPIAWASVLFTGTSPAHPDIAAQTNLQGRYRFADLTPGTYRVLVNAEGYPAQTQSVEAIGGQDVELDFHLHP